MMLAVWIGAVLVICGVVYMARVAIFLGDLSAPHATAYDPGAVTLEPERRGLRFVGLQATWPGIVMLVVGALLLLFGVFV